MLETYLRNLINIGDCPPVLLNFLEFSNSLELFGKGSALESFTLNDFSDKKVRIVSSKVKIVD